MLETMHNESDPPILQETDERFEIGASTIPGAGRGLFARVAMVPGERLAIKGVLVQPESAADASTRYADEYKFRVGDYLLIPVGYAGLVNHSPTPNLEKVIEGRRVYLQALRPIAAGEELFFCYSSYARSRFGLP
jgi:SET domain-containing protein